MKTPKLVLLLLVCFFSSITKAQENLFEELSYKQALKKSAAFKKPVLLFYEMDDNEKWNEVIPKALSKPDIARLINDYFISIKVSLESKDRIIVQDLVNQKVPFSLYFLDEEGSLLPFLKSAMPVSMDSVIKYALKTYQNRALVQQIEKTYFDKGNKNIEDLKKLIQAKTDLGLDTKLLLTEFINLLPRDSFNTGSVRFLMRQSPAFGSNAYQRAVNSANFSEAWWPMALQERIEINQRIIKKSTNIAITNRDMNYVKSVVQFARFTCNTEKDKLYAERTVLMNYYMHTGDTIRYMEIAAMFNDDYAAASRQAGIITATDSTDAADPEIPERLRQLNTPTAVRVAGRSPQAIYLNSAANYFYRIDREKRYLQKAVNWAALSVALYPDYMNRHTYALLLYRSGNKEQAIEMERLAIKNAKDKQLSIASKWEPLLQKMKDGAEIN
ncbi:hypothetical protein U0035_12155 [Niabella yanshanensis]|uniref:DUF255 domain-containing protein n=1 Tax=Niabella yanshanensis TaxID=577386 RepID=A0ABZ0W178_9BACT|nr:hypothetical protein [Niabella yanshanensis]WQD36418.1 hypothetical protein U0035_12155 [Niabella yanshanensis]